MSARPQGRKSDMRSLLTNLKAKEKTMSARSIERKSKCAIALDKPESKRTTNARSPLRKVI